MSQGRLFNRSILCQSVVKYSHSTGPRSTKDHNWTHVESPNLSVLVEHAQYDTAMILRVIQDTTNLEHIPLTAYIEEANNLRQRYPSVQLEDLPIFGMTKGSALAIRFTCAEDRVRRFQLRFADQASCKQLAQLLAKKGLKFGMPGTGTNTAQSQTRPTSTDSYSSPTAPFPTPTINVPRIYRDMEQQVNYHSDMNFNPQRSTPPSLARMAFGEDQQNSMTERQANFTFDKYPTPSMEMTSSPPKPTYREESFQERPMTAPNQQQSMTLHDVLPPRRELPFPKPSTSPGIPGTDSRRRTLKADTPLPTPSYAQSIPPTPNANQEYGGSNHGRPDSSPQRSRISRISTPCGPTKFDLPTSRTYDPRRESYHGSTVGSPSSDTMVTGNTSSVLTTSDNFVGSGIPIQTSRMPPTMTSPYTSSPVVEKTGTTSAVELDDRERMRRYYEQPVEARMEILNEFIIDHLDDPQFISLCEDVANCWRRKVLDRRS